eukprot:6176195-Pleurochrysis_carterae.AAC.1
MMTVGHTHEVIDSCFWRISGFWQRAGRVLNPAAFLELLRQAVPQSHVYSILTYRLEGLVLGRDLQARLRHHQGARVYYQRAR